MRKNLLTGILSKALVMHILLGIAFPFLPSCRKADHYAELINDQPFLITGEMGLNNVGLGVYPGYGTSWLVGDTATLIGKFFLDRPGSQIRIGADTAHILYKRQVPNGINQYTHQPDQLDYVRFLITRSMGLGDHIHVSISANGVIIQAPDISIRQFQGIIRKTDPTLYVDSLTTWKPADLNFYQKNYLPLVNATTIAGDGTICFNNLTGIYAIKNRQATQLLGVGDRLLEQGVPFTVKLVLGSVISFGGDTLIFSAEVRENTPDTATAFIFRLCKKDIVSGTITTINRTEVHKGFATINENPGPYEGAVSSLRFVATDLKTDANGSIYFLNNYPPARTDYNANLWYAGTFGGGLSKGGFFINNPHVLSNICRIEGSGAVKSLFSNHSPYIRTPLYTVPGYPSAQPSDYLVSLDGKVGYACDITTVLRSSLGYFDLQQDALLISTGLNPSGYRFFSYDTSSVTGRHTNLNPTIFFNNGYSLNNYLILPDGDLLFVSSGSLAAASLQNKTIYCYAGTEAGLGAPPAIQNQTTGPARNVLFWSTSFAGADKLNNIYYYTGYQNYKGISFYKLYSKK